MSLKTVLKSSVLGACGIGGLNLALRRILANRLLVLCYHGVVTDEFFEEHYCASHIGVREFRRHLEWLCRLYRPISAWDALDWITDGKPLPSRSVLVTFDDGFWNNLAHAVPELERYGVPALFHVSTGYIGTQRLLWPYQLMEQILNWPSASIPMPYPLADIRLSERPTHRLKLAHRVLSLCKDLTDDARRNYLDHINNGQMPQLDARYNDLFSFLSWDDVRTLHNRGFAIGSHTIDHPILSNLPLEALDRELQDSKAAIERELGAPCPWLAYPNGSAEDYSSHVIKRVKAAGFQLAFTLMDHINDQIPCPFQLDRVCMTANTSKSAFEARASGSIHVLRGQRSVLKRKACDCAACSAPKS